MFENIPNINLQQKARPTSGKPTLVRPKTGLPKILSKNEEIETFSKIQKITNNNTTSKTNGKLETKVITESFDENNSNNLNEDLKNINKEKFLDAIGEKDSKDAFDNILKEEFNRIQKVDEKKKYLCNINLLEKDLGDLYDWQNLFNNSRPLSSYTTIKKPKKNIIEDNKLQEFKSPIALVDLPEDQMNIYFGKNFIGSPKKESNKKSNETITTINSKNKAKKTKKLYNHTTINCEKNKKSPLKEKIPKKINKNLNNNTDIPNSISSSDRKKIDRFKNINHNVRPMSVFSPRPPMASFYFSSSFSDYYKEDLKSFVKKMPILKAKVKSNSIGLKKEIKTQRILSANKENKLSNILQKEQLDLEKQDLIIAAERKNPVPLLKSIFKQTNPDKEIFKEHMKMYYNTMKPLDGECDKVDYTQNDRWKLSKEICKMRNLANKNDKLQKLQNSFNEHYYINSGYKSKKINNLTLSYYDQNDPYIQLFDNIIEKNTTTKNNIENNPIFKKLNINEDNICYNPILKNINDNLDIKNNIQKISEIEKPKERPKTGSIGLQKNYSFAKKPSKNYNRPQTSINQYKYINGEDIEDKILQKYSELTADENHISSKCFPIKTSSNVGNVSYNKINQMIQERKLKKDDYFITGTGYINNKKRKNSVKSSDYNNDNSSSRSSSSRKKNRNKFAQTAYNKKNKWKNNFGLNYYIMLDKGSEFKNVEKEFMFGQNYFQKLGGKFYSSSNNANVKSKRNKKFEMLNHLFSESRYSNDEPELDYISEGVSSQTNSIAYK